MRRSRLLAATALLTGLALSACGGSGGDGTDDPQGIAAGSTIDATWPLTGLPVSGNESAAKHHPVMVLKLDNTTSSAPQLGLKEADLVVEEMVEGGVTRLAVFFYSTIPGDVGPVRSMRASDIGIVSPVGADVVTSGAAPVTISRIHGAGITFFGEGDKGFYRDSSRIAPYNLFTDMRQTVTLAQHKGAKRPPDYLPWGSESAFPGGRAARTIAASFSGGHTTDWTYRGSGYVNENSNAASDQQFPADSVLVLRVAVGDAGYLDPAGNHVPETKLVGTGPAMLFHDGQVVRGTWSKSDLTSALHLATKAGPLKVPAGHVWIELVPQDGGNVSFTKK